MKNKISGTQGEDIACKYLIENGFEILARNFRAGHKEIDIVATKDEITHFIEVKTRKNEEWLNLMDNISEKKMDFLIYAAEEWFTKKNLPESFWQIDFVGIIIDKDSQVTKIEFIEDIS